MAKDSSAVEMVLPPGVFITTTPALRGGLDIHVIHAHAGAAHHPQLAARPR